MIWKMLGHAQFQAVGRSPYLIPSSSFQAIAALGAVGNDGPERSEGAAKRLDARFPTAHPVSHMQRTRTSGCGMVRIAL